MVSLNAVFVISIRRARRSATVGTAANWILLGEELDVPEQAVFAGLGEGDGDAVASGSAGAADAMDVGLGRGGNVVVHHVGYVLHVEASRGHVGRDQQISGVGPELLHHPGGALGRGFGGLKTSLGETSCHAVEGALCPERVLGHRRPLDRRRKLDGLHRGRSIRRTSSTLPVGD